MKIEADNCGEVALYHGALYMWQAGRSDKARILIDKLLKQNKGSIPGLALRGWIDVTSGREGVYILRQTPSSSPCNGPIWQ